MFKVLAKYVKMRMVAVTAGQDWIFVLVPTLIICLRFVNKVAESADLSTTTSYCISDIS